MPGILDVQLVIYGAPVEDIAQFPAKTSKQGVVIKQDMSLLVIRLLFIFNPWGAALRVFL